MISYVRKLHVFAGMRLYVNLVCTTALSLFDALGIYLLIPMLGLIGVFRGQTVDIPLLSGTFETLRGLPVRSALPLALAVYVMLIAIQALLQRSQTVLNVKIQQGFICRLRMDTYEALMQANWIFFLRRRKSDFNQMLTTELARVSQGTNLFLQLSASLAFTVIQLGFAFWLSAKLTAAVLAGGLAVACLMRAHVRHAKTLGHQTTELSLGYFAAITDHFHGIKDIKSNRLEPSHLSWFRSLIDRMEANFVAFAKLQATTQFLYKAASAVLIALFVYLSFEVFRVPAAHLMVIMIVFARLWPRFTALQSGLEQLVSTLPAFEGLIRLQAECEEAKETREGDSLHAAPSVRPEQEIECRNVYFRYAGDESPYALRNVSIRIPAGGMTAIVGKSGAGKSTLIDILMGLVVPERGSVRIDGVTVTDEARLSLRSSVSYVSQDPFLFHASIRENLRIARPDAGEEEMWEALRFSASADFVSRLPQGLDTVVGDRGIRLSGGERQRIVLARAILRKPSILVLDEATSALDSENEAVIQAALERLKGEMTIIMIAHRLSTIRNVDQVIVLERGEVVQQGEFRQLSQETKGAFFQLLDYQLEGWDQARPSW